MTTLGIHSWSGLKRSYSMSPGWHGAEVGDFGVGRVAERGVPAVGVGGVEAHPDGDFFFFKDVGGEKNFPEAFPEVVGPILANPGELAAE